jgi:two-component system, NarL family, sensor histidine kinase UhpB
MERPLKILLLEDSATEAELIKRQLLKQKMPCEFHLAMDKENFLQALDKFSPDVILSDNSLPQFDATEALKITRQRSLHIPFILVTGTVSEEFAANIIKQGADDYILKDRMIRLPTAIDDALRKQESEKEKLTALQRLLRSEEKYRILVERVSDGFMAFDTKWNFVYANKVAEAMLARPAGYLMGKNMWSEFPESIDGPFFEAYHKAMQMQKNIHLQEYSVTFNRWMETSIYPSPSGLSVYFRDITEQKKAEEERKKLELELQELQRNEQLKIISTALEAQEKERNAIGQELHDNVNQILVGTKLMLSMVKNTSAEAPEILNTSINNLQIAIQENRKIAHELVTPDFETISLVDQVANLTDIMLKTSDIDVYINTTHFTEELLDGQQKLAVYRIAQEQCTNIVKYAKARLVNISLSTTDDLFKMIITDDGVGMETDKKTDGIGVRNIKGRLSIFNGAVNINSAPGKGFTLEITIPFKK